MPNNSKISRREALQLMGVLMALPPSLSGNEASAETPSVMPETEAFPVKIGIDASQPKGELHPLWRFYGADEPNYSYAKNGKKLLAELGEIGPAPVFFRTHNLLTTGDGTPALKWGSTNAYTEDAQGNPVYDWTIVDRIFEAGLAGGVKPYVQIGFMPEALSMKPEPYRHHWTPRAKYEEIYTGWAYPPKDYAKWGELSYQWAKHCVAKWGRAEVESWYWEVWNEPNIGYWQGTPDEYNKLYDYAVDGVRHALPTARVGGAEIAGGPGGDALRHFLEHCARGKNYATGQIGSPLDFVSFHAKGAPSFIDSHVQMGIAHQLNDIAAGCAVVASFPEFKDKSIVIGESDPDGCAACQGPSLGYRNGVLYASYTAASVARIYEIADKYGVHIEGALTWAFEFEDQPYFAGFRQLASNGIDLPVLNVFRMLGKMHGQRLAVESSADAGLESLRKNGVRTAPDVSALAAFDGKALSALVWHYHDEDVSGSEAEIALSLTGLPPGKDKWKQSHFRIDETHSNAYTVWKGMGSPAQPTPAQQAQLEHAGQLTPLGAPETVHADKGTLTTRLTLPRQSVSLLIWE